MRPMGWTQGCSGRMGTWVASSTLIDSIIQGFSSTVFISIFFRMRYANAHFDRFDHFYILHQLIHDKNRIQICVRKISRSVAETRWPRWV